MPGDEEKGSCHTYLYRKKIYRENAVKLLSKQR